MPERYRVAIIGCGGRGRSHLLGYQASGRCDVVAVADVHRPGAEAMAGLCGPEPPAVYADYGAMLAEVRPDIVSVCTWPDLHEPMVLAAVAHGARAIFAEKPMAPTWGQARAMVEAADRAGTVMIFCHQRRFGPPFRTARRLLRDGAIGRLQRIECTCDNLYDWGTHWFDMMHFYNDEQPAQWVLAQLDGRAPRRVFGALVENQGLSLVRFANGVQGLMITGEGRPFPESNRLVGTEGVIDVQMPGPDGKWIPIRFRGRGDGAHRIPDAGMDEMAPAGPGGLEGRAVVDLLQAMDAGTEPELSAARALRATELIFASYESSRRRGRVDLPLQTDDNALAAMSAAGLLGGS